MKNILITGPPGVGKTTLIQKIARQLGPHAGGFYTEEIRSGRVRTGFRTVTLEGREAMLAHTKIAGNPRVGKYGLDLAAFEQAALSAMKEAMARCPVIIIDEIGPMEEHSPAFKSLVTQCLDSSRCVIATIKEKGSRFVETIKSRADVKLIHVAPQNRDAMLDVILAMVQEPMTANG